MSTLTVDRRADPDDLQGADDEGRMPRRPRRRLLTRWSALLLAAMTCAIGFYVGVRVEKGQIASTPTTIGAGGGFAARGGAAAGGAASGSAGAALGAGASGAGTSGVGTSGAGTSGSTGGSTAGPVGPAGFAGRFGGGNATFGTVGSVDGNTLTLTEASGDTVKVKLTSATKITKSESARRRQIHPGDTVTVSGLTSRQGTISAATVTDSGARATGGSSASSSSTGSGSGSVSSLFSGG
jgi:hypothetical protein